LTHDFAVPFDVPYPPQIAPIIAFLDDFAATYERHAGAPVVPGQVAELFMSGAARDIDGFSAVLALEQASLAAVRERGFCRAMSVCTSKVTAHIAIQESSFQRVGAISYESFRLDGHAVFAPAAAVHHEAILVECIV
jgi:hypothetical protein